MPFLEDYNKLERNHLREGGHLNEEATPRIPHHAWQPGNEQGTAMHPAFLHTALAHLPTSQEEKTVRHGLQRHPCALKRCISPQHAC